MTRAAPRGVVSRRWVRTPALPLLLVLLSLGGVVASTVYVDDDAPAGACGSRDGTQPSPYCTIQEAIDVAVVGDQVEVAPGTYCEWIFMKNGVDVMSELGPEVTTIDAGGGGGGCAEQDFAAVRFSNTDGFSTLITTLSGFTITGGKGRRRTAAQRGQAGGARSGGGIFIFNSNNTVVTPIIQNNVITGNTLVTTDSYNYPLLLGGAIYVAVGRPLITNNEITGNSAADVSGLYGYGGAIYAANYSRPLVLANEITGNSAKDEGGALFFKTLPFAQPAQIVANRIENNTSGRLAGALMLSANSESVVTNNIIRGNHAATRGGAIHTYYASVDLRNNTITGNTALRAAGVFLGDSDAARTIDLHNNVISGNMATYAVFGTGVHLLDSSAATVSFSYNNLVDNIPVDFGGPLDPGAEPGNIAATPVFLNLGAGDLRLAPGSPGVDEGSDALATSEDLDGVTRPQDGDADSLPVADMGAHELLLTSGDDDSDGVFNDGDLSGVQGDNPCAFGANTVCDDNCPGQANGGQQNFDNDPFGDLCDPDDDNDGYLDVHEEAGCLPASDPLNAASIPTDNDGDLICDTLDPDIDNDGADNGSDCAPFVNSIDLPPAEVPLFLTLDSGDNLSWPTERQSNSFNVYRMVLAAGAPFHYDFACAVAHVPESQWNDPETPSLGGLQAYLVSGVSTCGEGVVGFDSQGMPIPTPVPACAGGGSDADSDLVADLDDNCPLLPNPNQEDQDTDGLGDLCDSCPGQAPLAGVGGSLTLSEDLETLNWAPDPLAEGYEVFRAMAGAGASFVPNYTCLGREILTSWADPLLPSDGEVLYYLVRSAKACDTSGAGLDAQGSPRPFRGSCVSP